MTNYTYTRDIPNAPNDPSRDQPIMKENTNSADSIWDVDHFGFNDNNGGLHSQCTIKEQGVYPSIPATAAVTFGTLYTQVGPAPIAGELFYVRGAGPAGIRMTGPYTPSAAVTGYTFLPGGMLLQWGKAGSKSNGNSISFPIAFPNACFLVVPAQYQTATESDQRSLSVVISSTTSFTIRITTLGSSPTGATAFLSWMAIGN